MKDENNKFNQDLEEQAPRAASIETEDAVESEAAAELEAEESVMRDVRIVSPAALVFKRFFRSRLSVIGLIMFIALLLFSFVGPMLSGWGETEVDRSPGVTTYTPLMTTFVGADGESYTVVQLVSDTPSVNIHAPMFSYGIKNYGTENEERVLHVFGTDKDGRDVLVRLMCGGRISLTVSFLTVVLIAVFGIIMGGLAGYFGKWVDMLIMRIVDIINCVPTLPILLIFSAILDAYAETYDFLRTYRIYIMMGFLTLISWTGTARLVRGQILFLREQEYMVAADALGMSSARKIFRHLVINVMPQLIVSMTLSLGSMILYEATLGYLQLGVPSPYASWGNMIELAKDPLVMQYYANEWLPSGICIILAVLAFNFVGDGVRDALDPKMKR